MKLIGKILLFCLFFLSISGYSQTNNISNNSSFYPTNWDFQIGINYNDGKFGQSCRLMYDLKPHIKAGFSLDYVRGSFYQSSGNASLGQALDTKFGLFEGYIISGVGFTFKDLKPIGIIGLGLAWETPLKFKINKYPIYLELGGEVDSYSTLDKPVFKQFFGFRVKF